MKLIAMDLDNTLLHHSPNGVIVHKEDIAAIKEFEQAGGVVAIASGRHHKEIMEISKEHGIGTYFICSNGAYCEDNEGKELYHAPFPVEDGKKILALAEQFSVFRIVANDDTYFCENKNALLRLIETRIKAHHVDDKNIREKMGVSVALRKIMFIGKKRTLLRLRNEIFEKFPTYQALFTSHVSLEIMPKEASKGQGLLALMKLLNLEADEVAAIGDSENDISMFKVAGHSYTFPNSLEHVKECAKSIVPSIEQMIHSFEKETE